MVTAKLLGIVALAEPSQSQHGLPQTRQRSRAPTGSPSAAFELQQQRQMVGQFAGDINDTMDDRGEPLMSGLDLVVRTVLPGALRLHTSVAMPIQHPNGGTVNSWFRNGSHVALRRGSLSQQMKLTRGTISHHVISNRQILRDRHFRAKSAPKTIVANGDHGLFKKVGWTVPHIDLQGREPGIIGLMQYRPETAAPMLELAEVLLRAESTLSPGERELIAAYVSSRNECTYCTTSHAQLAAKQLDDGKELVDAVCQDGEAGQLSRKMLALLKIAGAVQEGGRWVADSMIAVARDLGATDLEIHDTVLIAAAFSMYNRYVDGLATLTPAKDETYDQLTDMMVAQGYVALTPVNGPDRH